MKHRKTAIGLATIIISMIVFSSSASADVTWNVVNGKLVGASGVNVNGSLYDVEFRDGTCLALFGGCAESNFTFNTYQGVWDAASALLDQVFLDVPQGSFDTQPELTNGIEQDILGVIVTPYERKGEDVYFMGMFNYKPGYGTDDLGTAFWFIEEDSTNFTQVTYAIWKAAGGGVQVPEPATILLLASGLVGIGVVRRKLKVG